MTRFAQVQIAVLLIATAPLAAQERPLPAGVAPFVSVDAPVVALTHVRLVDGTGSPALDDHTVIVRGARIDAVGPAASTPIPEAPRCWISRTILCCPDSSASTSTLISAACGR